MSKNEDIIGDLKKEDYFQNFDYGCDGAEECCGNCGGDELDENKLETFILKALEAKDKAHQEEKRRLLEGIPCEGGSNCLANNDTCPCHLCIGYNQHVQEVKAYRDKELNNL